MPPVNPPKGKKPNLVIRPAPTHGRPPPKGGGTPAPPVNKPGPTSYSTPANTQTSRLASSRGARDQEYERFVESIRGRNSGLRTRRGRNRVTPVEDSMLGAPFDRKAQLPVAISEKWYRGTDQTIANSTTTTIEFGTSNYTVERTGYPPIYDATTFKWTIPPGLSGIWRLTGLVRWTANGTGQRTVLAELNGSNTIYHFRVDPGASSQTSMPIVLTRDFEEDDYILIRVSQLSTANLDLIGGAEYTHMTMSFEGVF